MSSTVHVSTTSKGSVCNGRGRRSRAAQGDHCGQLQYSIDRDRGALRDAGCGMPNVARWQCLLRPTSHVGPSQTLCDVGSIGSPGCHALPSRAAKFDRISHQQAEPVFFVLSTTWDVQLHAPARSQPTRRGRQRNAEEVKATISVAGYLLLVQPANAGFGQSWTRKQSRRCFSDRPFSTPDHTTEDQIWKTKCEMRSGPPLLWP